VERYPVVRKDESPAGAIGQPNPGVSSRKHRKWLEAAPKEFKRQADSRRDGESDKEGPQWRRSLLGGQ
jgi:hypothetical protein